MSNAGHNPFRAVGVAWLLAVAALVIGAHGCRAPTEVDVRVTTEFPCRELKGVSITVGADASSAEERARTSFFAASTHQCDSDTTVGTLVLTPGATSFAFIVIAGLDRESSACTPPDYVGCIVARRRLSFVDNATLEVPVTLARDCLDIACDAETSCVRGNCKSSETACSGSACAQDVTAPLDGGGPDARDGQSDGTLDGPGTDAADAASDAFQSPDASDGATSYDGGAYTCTSSPSCAGQPAPCSCAGQIQYGAGTSSMTMSCAAGAPLCTCSIGGTLVKSFANLGSCTSTNYGNFCCSH